MTLIRAGRSADAGPIARLHAASWRDSYRGMLPDAALDGPLEQRWSETWRHLLADDGAPGRQVLVAVDDDGLAGFVSAGRLRDRGRSFSAEIYTLYVAKARRGQGLGGRLMGAVATRLALFGHGDVALWTLAANAAARRFYESLAGEAVGRRDEMISGARIPEIAYGWRDIHRLIDAAADRAHV